MRRLFKTNTLRRGTLLDQIPSSPLIKANLFENSTVKTGIINNKRQTSTIIAAIGKEYEF